MNYTKTDLHSLPIGSLVYTQYGTLYIKEAKRFYRRVRYLNMRTEPILYTEYYLLMSHKNLYFHYKESTNKYGQY
mgnify:CR=1 FL=1|jgi:hypothetical protein